MYKQRRTKVLDFLGFFWKNTMAKFRFWAPLAPHVSRLMGILDAFPVCTLNMPFKWWKFFLYFLASCEYVRPTPKIETHFETSIENDSDYIQEEPGYKHTNEVEPSNKETESANHMYEASNDIKEYQTANGSDNTHRHHNLWSVLLLASLTLFTNLHPRRW